MCSQGCSDITHTLKLVTIIARNPCNIKINDELNCIKYQVPMNIYRFKAFHGRWKEYCLVSERIFSDVHKPTPMREFWKEVRSANKKSICSFLDISSDLRPCAEIIFWGKYFRYIRHFHNLQTISEAFNDFNYIKFRNFNYTKFNYQQYSSLY